MMETTGGMSSILAREHPRGGGISLRALEARPRCIAGDGGGRRRPLNAARFILFVGPCPGEGWRARRGDAPDAADDVVDRASSESLWDGPSNGRRQGFVLEVWRSPVRPNPNTDPAETNPSRTLLLRPQLRSLHTFSEYNCGWTFPWIESTFTLACNISNDCQFDNC